MDENFLARMNDGQNRDRVLDQFNRENMDDVGPVGGQEGMKLLSEMKSLVDKHDLFMKSLMQGKRF